MFCMTNIKTRTLEALEAGKIVGDGHTIFTPDFYSPYFSEYELVEAGLMTTLKSDYSSAKSTIFGDDGVPLEELTGVYNLSFLEWLAEQVGATDYPTYNGRGSQARAIVEAIKQALS